MRNLNQIIVNWRNGNLTAARITIKNLTKLELVGLLTHHHRLEDGFIGDMATRIKFEDFVELSLRWVR